MVKRILVTDTSNESLLNEQVARQGSTVLKYFGAPNHKHIQWLSQAIDKSLGEELLSNVISLQFQKKVIHMPGWDG